MRVHDVRPLAGQQGGVPARSRLSGTSPWARPFALSRPCLTFIPNRRPMALGDRLMRKTGLIGALTLAAVMALSGCSLPDLTSWKGFTGKAPSLQEIGAKFTDAPPARMGVAQGAVVIAGPKGFCIDRDVSQDAMGQQALTVLSACRELGAGLFDPKPQHPAVLTAAVAPAGPQIPIASSEAQLKSYFTSERGLRGLSRNGLSDSVTLQEHFVEGDVFFLHLTDMAPFAWGKVQPEYWRALFPAGGRMVTAAVLAVPGQPLGRDEGLALLREFVTATRIASLASGQN